MTPDEVIFHRRVQCLAHASRIGNITEACRVFGVSRTTFYEWSNTAAAYGLEALMPKGRRVPQMPNATPTHVVAELLTLAVTEPTLGCRQLADALGERGYVVGKTTVQKHLVAHGLGRRAQRLARAAAIAAATTGLVTEAAGDDRRFGFCHFAARPGDLVALDNFYIGNLKGVGRVYQLTAVDTATRWAFARLVVGHVSAKVAAMFLHQLAKETWQAGIVLSGVLTDNGPEFIGGDFRTAVLELELVHHRIPPRSPDHNAVVERFHGTVLQECYRPAFHRRRFDRLADLDEVLQDFLDRYNTHRRNHGDYMKGRIPAQMLEAVTR
jgi:transposase InsO family protein